MEGQNTEQTGNDLLSGEERKIPVIQEQLIISKERVETGRVLLSKQVVEENMSFVENIAREEVTVHRKAINQYVDSAPPAVRQEGDVTIISVVKEVLVVEKRLMLVEELHIEKQRHHDQQNISEILRKEEITITREGPGTKID